MTNAGSAVPFGAVVVAASEEAVGYSADSHEVSRVGVPTGRARLRRARGRKRRRVVRWFAGDRQNESAGTPACGATLR